MPQKKKVAIRRKKSVRRSAGLKKRSSKTSEGKLIGRITHYFSNIKVAVVELSAPLKIGEAVRIIGGKETDFKQKVSSMQIEHEQVKSAKKGDSVGMKVDEKAREGYRVFKI